jgi:hypothetical protein
MSNRKGANRTTKKGSIEANPGIAAAEGAASGAAIAMEPVAGDPSSLWMGDREAIARLAYEYWEARGCPDGSPEEDWFRAEKTLARPARPGA